MPCLEILTFFLFVSVHFVLISTHCLLCFRQQLFPPKVDIIHVYVMISPTSTICGFQLFLALPFSVTSMSLGRIMSSGVGE